jgi:hypothetical protein
MISRYRRISGLTGAVASIVVDTAAAAAADVRAIDTGSNDYIFMFTQKISISVSQSRNSKIHAISRIGSTRLCSLVCMVENNQSPADACCGDL